MSVSILGKLGTSYQKNSAPESFRPCLSPGCCISGTLPWRRKATVWYSHLPAIFWWCGGEGSGYLRTVTWSCAQQLYFGGEIPPHNSLSVVWFCKPSIVCPVCSDPGPIGGFQVIVGFLGPEGFLIWDSPPEASVSLVVIVVHKYSDRPESCVG